MSNKGKKKRTNDEIRRQKKNAVMKKDNKSRLPLIILLLGLVSGVSGIFLYQTVMNNGETAIVTAEAPDKHESEIVTYDVNLFADGQARHFTFLNDDGKEIRYFIVKSSDGVIRAAFDACDVCWPAGKGYLQDGDQMVCRNCGRRFDSIRINEVKGGCNPAPLFRKVEGDRLIIQKAHILEGFQYFNFSRKV